MALVCVFPPGASRKIRLDESLTPPLPPLTGCPQAQGDLAGLATHPPAMSLQSCASPSFLLGVLDLPELLGHDLRVTGAERLARA